MKGQLQVAGSPELTGVAERAIASARRLGAEEITARVSRGEWTDVGWRDERLEKSQRSESLSLSVSLLVDDRYSVHVTSDLRPDALEAFLERAVAATRFLEPDPDRRLPALSELGSADVEALDLVDPDWSTSAPSASAAAASEIVAATREAASNLPLRSAAATVWDGRTESCTLRSNGFAGAWASTRFGHSAEVSLSDPSGRVPEAMEWSTATHRDDVTAPLDVARTAVERARRRLGSGAAPSGRYPMLLENSRVGRLLSALITPMSGQALFEGRSWLAGRVGTKVASSALTLLDDPLIPRALGSHPFDRDGLPATPRALVEDGVLASLFVGVYHGRRLGLPATTANASNLVIPPGARSPTEIAADLPRLLVVEGFLGGNANPATGNFSFGVTGRLIEHGAPTRNISEMNVSGNLADLLARFVEAANDPWRWSTWRSPSLLFDGVQFSGL